LPSTICSLPGSNWEVWQQDVEGDHGAYRIDFDWIGWKLQEKDDKERLCQT
jgi:hypothetical protein